MGFGQIFVRFSMLVNLGKSWRNHWGKNFDRESGEMVPVRSCRHLKGTMISFERAKSRAWHQTSPHHSAAAGWIRLVFVSPARVLKGRHKAGLAVRRLASYQSGTAHALICVAAGAACRKSPKWTGQRGASGGPGRGGGESKDRGLQPFHCQRRPILRRVLNLRLRPCAEADGRLLGGRSEARCRPVIEDRSVGCPEGKTTLFNLRFRLCLFVLMLGK